MPNMTFVVTGYSPALQRPRGPVSVLTASAKHWAAKVANRSHSGMPLPKCGASLRI
jgi:hypothetical protein